VPSRRRPEPRQGSVQEASADPLLRLGTVPLRLFLGVTFLYAGLQKLNDPGYLVPGSTTYIGTQLQSFAGRSPIGFLLEWLATSLPVPTGVAVMLGEMAIGVLVLLGIATRWAAIGGALLSAALFLTASWTVQPYFLGSDSIYAVAWITLALVGDQGVLSLQRRLRRRSPQPVDAQRRTLLLRIATGSAAVIWLLAILPKATRTAASGKPAASTSTSPTPSTEITASASGSASPVPAGTKVGTMSQLQAAGSLLFQDPQSGDPGVVVDLGDNHVVAFDAICTHAGCTVQYQADQRLLVCPCHGATYDPAQGAQVLRGPAPQPLASIDATLAGDGSIYVK
jgi:thiosulfate dehydrogenase (quinone) large subunit